MFVSEVRLYTDQQSILHSLKDLKLLDTLY